MLNYVQAHCERSKWKDLPYAYFHSMSSGLVFFPLIFFIFHFFLFICRNGVWIIFQMEEGSGKKRMRQKRKNYQQNNFFLCFFMLIVTNSCYNRIWENIFLHLCELIFVYCGTRAYSMVFFSDKNLKVKLMHFYYFSFSFFVSSRVFHEI